MVQVVIKSIQLKLLEKLRSEIVHIYSPLYDWEHNLQCIPQPYKCHELFQI